MPSSPATRASNRPWLPDPQLVGLVRVASPPGVPLHGLVQLVLHGLRQRLTQRPVDQRCRPVRPRTGRGGPGTVSRPATGVAAGPVQVERSELLVHRRRTALRLDSPTGSTSNSASPPRILTSSSMNDHEHSQGVGEHPKVRRYSRKCAAFIRAVATRTQMTPSPVLGGMSPSVGEAEDVAPLPRSFDGTGVVVLAHEVHCLAGRYSVQNCETGQGCAGSAAATAAGDLDAFDAGASPCLTKDGLGLGVTAGQPEVWPAQPPDFPGDLGRLSAKQVDGVGRCRTGRNRSAKRAATDQAPGGKPQHTSVSSLPSVGHPLTVVGASGDSLSAPGSVASRARSRVLNWARRRVRGTRLPTTGPRS